jgi:MFS family permease
MSTESSFINLMPRRRLGAAFVATFMMETGEELWMRYLPKYLSLLGVGPVLIGAFESLRSLAFAGFAYPGGMAVDRWGHRRALEVFIGLAMAGCALLWLSPHWIGLLAGLLLFQAWSGLSMPVSICLVGATLSKRYHAAGLGVQALIKRGTIIIGAGAGGLLVGQLGLVEGVKIGMLAAIGLGAGALASIRLLPAGAPKRDREVERTDFTPWRTIAAFPTKLRQLLWCDTLVRFGERLGAGFVVLHAFDRVRLDAPTVGGLLAMEAVIALSCYLPAGLLADRWGREPFVLVTFALFALVPALLAVTESAGMMVLVFGLRGLREIGEPARRALILAHCGDQAAGRKAGAYFFGRDILTVAAPMIGGGLWMISPSWTFGGAALCGAVAAGMFAWSMLRDFALSGSRGRTLMPP